MTNEITSRDVLSVAISLDLQPTKEEIQQVLDMYDSEAKQDPTGHWIEITEHCLYSLGYLTLRDKVLGRIKKDVSEGDVTAIEVMLNSIHNSTLESYLGEN